jgi:DnaJ family protein A protein 3
VVYAYLSSKILVVQSLCNVLQVNMNLTFMQAARGCNKELEVNVTDTCPRCRGSKAEPDAKKVRCHVCGGTGMVDILMFLLHLVSCCIHI